MAALRAELASLDPLVQSSLRSGELQGLRVVGYGEISAVLRFDVQAESFAAKPLPRFDSAARLEAYRRCVSDYVARLRERGVGVLDSQIIAARQLSLHPPTQSEELGSASVFAYCVQPLVPEAQLCVHQLARMNLAAGRELGAELFDLISRVVGPQLGLDAQVSNWFRDAERLVYLDVTTPLFRGPEGDEALDTELFLASLPLALRGLVRRFMLSDLLGNYYHPRRVLLDVLGNLIKDGLSRHLPGWLDLASAYVTPALSLTEVRAHYARDARAWALLQRLRRLDQRWQHTVRRGPYGFVLPPRVSRR